MTVLPSNFSFLSQFILSIFIWNSCTSESDTWIDIYVTRLTLSELHMLIYILCKKYEGKKRNWWQSFLKTKYSVSKTSHNSPPLFHFSLSPLISPSLFAQWKQEQEKQLKKFLLNFSINFVSPRNLHSQVMRDEDRERKRKEKRERKRGGRESFLASLLSNLFLFQLFSLISFFLDRQM